MKAGILIGHLNDHGNEGNIIRTTEAFGLNNIFVLGKRKPVYGTSQGADRHVNFYEFSSEEEVIDYCIKNNHHIVCIENITSAIEIGNLTKPDRNIWPQNPIFITGNEARGVPESFLKVSDLTIKIDQGFGYVNCLNTAVALAIVIHAFIQYRRDRRENKWGDAD